MDPYPRLALGARHETAAPAPKAPTPDEQWHYLADSLASIRRAVTVLAVVALIQIAVGVAWAFAWLGR